MEYRDSKIEVLRIVSIFLIILGHIAIETKWNFFNMTIPRVVSIETMWIGAKLGVNIFFLITGYFLISKNSFRITATIKIWLTTIFYSWILTIFSIIFLPNILNVEQIIQFIFPVFFGTYWFITVYIVLMLLSPFINKFLKNLSQSEFLWILIVGFIYLFVCSTFFKNLSTGTSGDIFITSLYVYMLGSYIGLYKSNFINKKYKLSKHLSIFILMILLMICSVAVMSLLIKHHLVSYDSKRLIYFIGGNSPFEVIASMELFIITLNKNSFYNSFINKISNTVLSVYIMHTHYLFSIFIIPTIINAKKFQYSNILVIYLYCFLWTACILILLVIIDLIRQYFLNNIEIKVINNVSNKLKSIKKKFLI
ncbi:MAG: acyltransferase [Lactobacillus sp.]|uniref:acyltransferase family protein n=1 Tax=Bombilactobacillus bombi TaxID=1303590 RepID=UPI0035EECBC0|nr:acyltransferase [Lactobacillus sp.]